MVARLLLLCLALFLVSCGDGATQAREVPIVEAAAVADFRPGTVTLPNEPTVDQVRGDRRQRPRLG